MGNMIVWVEVPGYEGRYRINRAGEVTSVKKLITVKPKIDDRGRRRVELHKNGKGKSFFVHYLLALTFIPNPDSLPSVIHKDGNRLNNRLDNLRWGYRGEGHPKIEDKSYIRIVAECYTLPTLTRDYPKEAEVAKSKSKFLEHVLSSPEVSVVTVAPHLTLSYHQLSAEAAKGGYSYERYLKVFSYLK